MTPHHEGASHGSPNEELRAEHDAIEHLLQAVDGMALALDTGRSVPRRDLDDALETLRGFADACHHAKEEKVLFPALRAASPTEGERIARELEGDHMAGRKLIAAMREASAGAASGDTEEAKRFSHNARLYSTMLRRHIENETTKLFPLVERALSHAERERVAEAFARVEREETGSGAHERYESTIHDLHHRYARG